jgi:hypothetical protein
MRNRAKCKLCGDVIESMHATDLQECKCGEIGLDGGPALKCMARNWENFIRVDDYDKEVAIKTTQKPFETVVVDSKPSKADLIEMLDEMIRTYEGLPSNAMTSPVTHYDVLSVLLVVSALFKAEA